MEDILRQMIDELVLAQNHHDCTNSEFGQLDNQLDALKELRRRIDLQREKDLKDMSEGCL